MRDVVWNPEAPVALVSLHPGGLWFESRWGHLFYQWCHW